MDNILEVLKMNTPVEQPAPTEKAQIVINYNFASPAPIFRYNNVKKAQADYARLCKTWLKYTTNFAVKDRFIEMNGDMFVGTIDLSTIACVNFVDLAKRAKFIPANF